MVHNRLDKRCEGIDRTADMGMFPHDPSSRPLFEQSDDGLVSVAADSKQDPSDRDQAIWSLVYKQSSDEETRGLPDLLMSVATEADAAVLRRSASWALLKIGEPKLLAQSLRADDDGNVHSWKQHLIYESQGRTDWVDPRPVRALKQEHGYAVTLPLTIHGKVVFRDYNYEDREDNLVGIGRRGQRADGARASSVASGAYGRPQGSLDADSRAASAGYSAGSASPADFTWYDFAAGPIVQRRLVGDLTAAVGHDSFYDNLTIQKVVTNPLGDGRDHVQGYLFEGTSRSLGGNAMAHYYTSRGAQPLYLSGRIGDASDGVVSVDTQLVRHAETHIVSTSSAPYPYVQSVRGLFFGPARMNPVFASRSDVPLDNMLQIVKEPFSNGWFFGEFRSVPVDVDGDDQVELNGMEMFTTLDGRVVDRTPQGPQPSVRFAR